jgi:hypothetical protein
VIRSQDIEPYRQRVRDLRKRNPKSKLWEGLEKVWQAHVDHAVSTMADYRNGLAMSRRGIDAAEMISTLGQHVPASEVVNEVAALVMMWRKEPRRFTDEGFRHLIVKRLRVMSPAFKRSTWVHEEQRTTTRTSKLPHRTTQELAGDLIDGIGKACLHLALASERLDQSDAERKAGIAQAAGQLK